MPEARIIAPGAVGAHVGSFGVSYRVWSPDAREVAALIERSGSAVKMPLTREAGGFWSVVDGDGAAGDRYRFILDGAAPLPDIASRFQPDGIEGASECIDPETYRWDCTSWLRPGWRGQTTYEVHVGTLTPQGTFRSAAPTLEAIRGLGAEAIELMPVADFAGSRNWGYDGVCLFAPARCYGRPDDLRHLVDRAHALGLAVILDVVYNHVGPQGGHIAKFAADYFRREGSTPWGRGFNLDGPGSGPVRELLKTNAAYWLDEFRIDGLRLDATHAIVDGSPSHLIQEIAEIAHSRGAFVVAEDERNTVGILRTPEGGGLGVDAAWADDFHHQVRVALTGIQRSYFSGYQGKASDIADTIRHGWSYRGQSYLPWGGRPRGDACDFLPPSAFVYCIENHDQVGNRAFGERLEHLVDPAGYRAASMLLCLNPHPVLIFMGQEWAASAPFLFFCDHGGELGRNISQGRQKELGESEPSDRGAPPDPEDPKAFERSKLAWGERRNGLHAGTLALYEACLRERLDLVDRGALSQESWTVHSEGPLVAVRYQHPARDHLLLVNLQDRSLFPESLPDSLRPEPGQAWRVVLDSESSRFGGSALAAPDRWTLHGPGALWLESVRKDPDATH